MGYGINTNARPDYNKGLIHLDPVSGGWRPLRTPLDGTGLFVTPTLNGLPLANSMTHGGGLGRNTLCGEPHSLANAGLMKTFDLTEQWKLPIRGDG